jgi:hypothetical protein
MSQGTHGEICPSMGAKLNNFGKFSLLPNKVLAAFHGNKVVQK